MITDKLENIQNYTDLPKVVLDFIKSLNIGIQLGKQILSEDVYVNIEEYSTKLVSDAKFETHKEYIDIQILLKGSEEIYYADNKELNVDVPYDTSRDIAFYSDRVAEYPKFRLDGTNFIILYPPEAHAPQVSIDEKPQKVKKVVVKIKKDYK